MFQRQLKHYTFRATKFHDPLKKKGSGKSQHAQLSVVLSAFLNETVHENLAVVILVDILNLYLSIAYNSVSKLILIDCGLWAIKRC